MGLILLSVGFEPFYSMLLGSQMHLCKSGTRNIDRDTVIVEEHNPKVGRSRVGTALYASEEFQRKPIMFNKWAD